MSNDNIMFFDMGGWLLAIHPWEMLKEDISHSNGEVSRNSRSTIAVLAETEVEVDDILNRAASLDCNVIKEPQKTHWGGYSGYFEDINGHYWEIAYNPFVEIDSSGQLDLT